MNPPLQHPSNPANPQAVPWTPGREPSGSRGSGAEHELLRFPTQRADEHAILLLRRHWTILAKHIVRLVLSLLIPPVLFLFLFLYTTFSLAPGTPLYILVVEGFSLYYLFAFLSYFHHFIDYHLDIWVVSDQRIVSIEQEGLFNRVVAELSIERIQDVTSEMKGKIQTFLNFGNVHIQTAGEQARFVFEQIPHPAEVAKIILQIHDRVMKKAEWERVRQSEVLRQQMATEQSSSHPRGPTPPAVPGAAPQQ